MKFGLMLLGAMFAMSSVASADYQMTREKKKIVCYGEDNVAITLNAKQTTLKFEVEGESLGAKKIIRKHSDGESIIVFENGEITVTMGSVKDPETDSTDYYTYGDDEEKGALECHLE